MNVAFCGDGIVQAGERCDLGSFNGQQGYNCTTTCQVLTVSTCGNATVDAGEECDDGNVRNRDGCDTQCKIEQGSCGDGSVQSALGEQCDAGDVNGQPGADCDAACRWVRLPQCGDGTVDPAVEQCDTGRRNGNYPETRCLSNCTLPFCGDGINEVNEQCDDGNMLSGDGCDYACRLENPAAPFFATLLPGQNLPPSQPQYTGKIPTPARTPTGPGLVIFLASGAAAGFGLLRRRWLK